MRNNFACYVIKVCSCWCFIRSILTTGGTRNWLYGIIERWNTSRLNLCIEIFNQQGWMFIIFREFKLFFFSRRRFWNWRHIRCTYSHFRKNHSFDLMKHQVNFNSSITYHHAATPEKGNMNHTKFHWILISRIHEFYWVHSLPVYLCIHQHKWDPALYDGSNN